MSITVNSLKQNKHELIISGVGLDKPYITVLIDGRISSKISSSYRKIIAGISESTSIKSVSVQLHINEKNNRHYIYAGQIHLSNFKNGTPVAVFENTVNNVDPDESSEDQSNSSLSDISDSSNSTINGSSESTSSNSSEISISSSSSSDDSLSSSSSSSDSILSSSSLSPSSITSNSILSDSSLSDSSLSGSSEDSSTSSSHSLDSDSSSSSLSLDSDSSSQSSQTSSNSGSSSSQSTENLPYVIYRIDGGIHWDDSISYNGSAPVPFDNNPF